MVGLYAIVHGGGEGGRRSGVTVCVVCGSALPMRVPAADSPAPRAWWDVSCDVSLLVGTYLHGYENYLSMRIDPQLVYMQRLGPPDAAECITIK